MLIDRERTILEAIVRDYILSAIPVSSSKVLAREKRLEASPATVRNIMIDLEEEGYIIQPHTSAGRMPTQKGYRYFVDNCLDEPMSPVTYSALEHISELTELLQFISKKTNLFTAAFIEDRFITYGIGSVMRQPEFNDAEQARTFGIFIDALQEQAEEYIGIKSQEEPLIFIEEENPIPEGRFTGVVTRTFLNGRGALFTVGPSRMNYEKVISILNISQNANITNL